MGVDSSCGMVVHPCTGVQGTVGGRGWSKGEGGRARAALREKRRRSGRCRGGSEGRRGRQGAPVTTRYGSLSDRCRYRVAVSPESVGRSPLRHFSRSLALSLARSLSPARRGWTVPCPRRGGACRRGSSLVRPLARQHVHVRSLATLSSFGGCDDSRARG